MSRTFPYVYPMLAEILWKEFCGLFFSSFTRLDVTTRSKHPWFSLISGHFCKKIYSKIDGEPADEGQKLCVASRVLRTHFSLIPSLQKLNFAKKNPELTSRNFPESKRRREKSILLHQLTSEKSSIGRDFTRWKSSTNSFLSPGVRWCKCVEVAARCKTWKLPARTKLSTCRRKSHGRVESTFAVWTSVPFGMCRSYQKLKVKKW